MSSNDCSTIVIQLWFTMHTPWIIVQDIHLFVSLIVQLLYLSRKPFFRSYAPEWKLSQNLMKWQNGLKQVLIDWQANSLSLHQYFSLSCGSFGNLELRFIIIQNNRTGNWMMVNLACSWSAYLKSGFKSIVTPH